MHPSSLHVAIIMDGNGRWAMARALPRTVGHRAGMEAVRRVVDAAPELEIGALTLFAFSSNNWQRPADQVEGLMDIFRAYFEQDLPLFLERGIRVNVMGRRDRLPAGLRSAIDEAELATAGGSRLHLRIALDYSGREALLRAARRARSAYEISPETFAFLLAEVSHSGSMVPDIDLLIRTGGEQRLSDVLLWESAYAELVFTPNLWPDFHAADLQAAIEEYHHRERRFGQVHEVAIV
ncbi:MAG: di-trans,poly-cis-decaprenylcistransferase [Acidobacteria bacterium]|nr:di-trans,poly-cis-decaprenylcistransferase [Acidobacteriota bacterium]